MSALDHARVRVDVMDVGQADPCPDPSAATLASTLPQLCLFGEVAKKIKRATIRRKKPRTHGLQYRIKLTIRKSDRKIAYRTRMTDDEPGNEFEWPSEQDVRMHTILLDDSLETLRNMCERSSARAAEIMAWVERRNCSDAFSFETCCALYRKVDDDGEVVGPLDPDIVRPQLRNLIRKVFSADLPHAAVLRKGIQAAESGDFDAIEWIFSDSSAPLSFITCCFSLGFEPDEARQEVHLPNPLDDDDGLDAMVQRAIDSVYGPYDAAVAA